MKASEILHGLAELLSGIEAGQGQEINQQTAQTPSLTVVDVDNTDNTDNTESSVFVPPLQAKIELLKKSVNVDSIYDQTGADEDLTGQGADNEDELARMKQLSGIKNPVAQEEMGSDEPLDV
jgi:hypothetical protein